MLWRMPSNNKNSLPVSTAECTPSAIIAELPVNAATTNLLAAMPAFAAIAAYTTFLECDRDGDFCLGIQFMASTCNHFTSRFFLPCGESSDAYWRCRRMYAAKNLHTGTTCIPR